MRGEQYDESWNCVRVSAGSLHRGARLTGVFAEADGDVIAKAVQAAQSFDRSNSAEISPFCEAVIRPPVDQAGRLAVSEVRAALRR